MENQPKYSWRIILRVFFLLLSSSFGTKCPFLSSFHIYLHFFPFYLMLCVVVFSAVFRIARASHHFVCITFSSIFISIFGFDWQANWTNWVRKRETHTHTHTRKTQGEKYYFQADDYNNRRRRCQNKRNGKGQKHLHQFGKKWHIRCLTLPFAVNVYYMHTTRSVSHSLPIIVNWTPFRSLCGKERVWFCIFRFLNFTFSTGTRLCGEILFYSLALPIAKTRKFLLFSRRWSRLFSYSTIFDSQSCSCMCCWLLCVCACFARTFSVREK